MADEEQGTQQQEWGITLAEIQLFFTENWSHAAASMADTFGTMAAGAAMDAAEFNARMSQLYANEFLYSASRASAYSQAAAAAGEAGRAGFYSQLANQYSETAASARTMATQAFAESQAALLNMRLANAVPVAAIALEVGEMYHLASEGKWNELGRVSTGIFYSSLALAMLEAAGAFAALTLGGALLLVAFVGLIVGYVGHLIWDNVGGFITDEVSDLFTLASNWFQRRDPLTFDLDGDGIESIGLSASHPVLFDHDGDGIKNGTGWISADDGFLVYDRNGNGTIDSGRELFGDSTLLPDGSRAEDGFAALTAEDTNQDGMVSAADANFAQLRMWRDLNQDGVSQATELFTLQELGIAAINVASVQRDRTLSNGNQIADVGTFVRTDGTEGTVGEVQETADVNLAESTFRRQFTDYIPLIPEVANLPEMGGSGKVRDLQEAASQSPGLLAILQQFSAAQTRGEQLALVDSVLAAWAHTAGMESMEQRADDVGYAFGWWRIGSMTYPGSGTAWAAGGGSNGNSGAHVMPQDFPDPDEWEHRRDEWDALVAKTENMLAVLEAFNGHYFYSMPEDDFQGARSGPTMVAVTPGTGGGGSTALYNGPPGITIGLLDAQLALLQQSYDALRESVYRALALQTRLQTFTGLITFFSDPSGSVTVSYAAQEAEFARRIQENAVDGMADLIDYTRGMAHGFAGSSWKGWELVESYIRTLPVTPALQALYDQAGVKYIDGPANTWFSTGDGGSVTLGTAANDYVQGGNGQDAILGGDGNDTLSGGTSSDSLLGQSGNDSLHGDAGHDVLIGGTGNDWLQGGVGDDTYVFGAGDGQDYIENYDAGVGRKDALNFKPDVRSGDVILGTDGSSLIITFRNSADRVTVQGFFANDDYALNSISFSDGTTWDLATIKAKVQSGTSGDDVLTAHESGSTMYGNEGNDTLIGGVGRDQLEGGNGSDTLEGGDGDDTIYDPWGANIIRGGAGNDTITAAGTIEGGTGSDAINGDGWITTYIYNLGDGLDTISDYGYGMYTDTLQLGEGIAAASVTLVRTGNDLTLRISETDQITITNWFADVYYYGIEQITFADGTTWDQAAMQQMAIAPFFGTDGADTINGWNGLDTIDGGAGNDSLNGQGGNDTLSGSAGNDVLHGQEGNDVLAGGDGNDDLQGDNGSDSLDGGDGDDTIYDLWGANTTRGGAGNDTITAAGTIEAGTGNDTINGDGWITTYNYNPGDGIDTIADYGYGVYGDTLKLGAGIDPASVTLIRSGNDMVFRMSETDQVIVKNWFADVYYNAIENVTFADGTAWDLATMYGMTTTPFVGTAGVDTINGWEGIDIIDGADGNDALSGWGGNDTLAGGAGNDVLHGQEGNDVLTGGDGNDDLQGDNGSDTLEGGAGDDSIYDLWGANNVRGGAGNDTITAAGTIEAGTGNDTINGDGWMTTYVYNQGDGLDTIADYGYGAYADTLQLGAGITPASVTFIRSGEDLIFRFSAIDQVTIKNWFADVYMNAIERVTFADGTVWDQATMQTFVGQQFVGTSGNDTINGWEGIDLIDGADGNDTINGAGGNDTLLGSGGNDALHGNEGNDLLVGGDGNDNLQGDNGSDTLEGGEGEDTIYDLWGANTVRGGAGNDTITAAGTLEAGTGNDTINGDGWITTFVYNSGDGVDTIADYGYGAYGDTLQLGAGIDPASVTLIRSGDDMVFRMSATDQVIVKNWFADVYMNAIENVTFANGTAWNLTTMYGMTTTPFLGTAAADTINGWEGIDIIDGGDGNDAISGWGGNDTLTGGAGNDALHGNEGDDALTGGDGNDNLQGDNGSDTIDGGAGDDTVYDLWGANVVRGGAGNDTITAAGTIEAGTGNDTINGDGWITTYVYNLGDGVDTIADYGYGAYGDTLKLSAGIDPASVTLIRSGDDMVFRMSAADQVIIKNWFADVYYYAIENVTFADGTAWNLATMYGMTTTPFLGTAAADTINGWEGIDVIDGGDGNDAISGWGGNDTLTGGTGNDTLHGNEGDDALTGGDGNDNLQGDNGSDTIDGGAGDDTVYDLWGANITRGGAGNDTITAAGTIEAGTGNDTINGDGWMTNYIYSLGDGTDSITDVGYGAYGDTLQLGISIAPTSVTLVRNGNDMVFRISETDQVIIKNWFADVYYYAIENVTFADGTAWNLATMYSMTTTPFLGTAAADTINGWEGIDVIDGGDGNDAISGWGGNDTLTGGTGNDTLHGNEGNDVLVGGDGNDDLQGDNGSDTIEGGAGADTVYDLWGANVVRGGAGNDTLTAAGTIEAGTGNDTINGDGWMTNYIYSLGDGADSITDVGYGAYGDTLQLGIGIAPASVTLVRSGNDMVFRISETDQVTVKNWYSDVYYYAIENVTFADGTAWTLANMYQFTTTPFMGTTAADTINGWEGIDIVDGGDGNDAISGWGGNDMLTGSAGNDALHGNEGDDALTGGDGDDNLQGDNGSDTLEGGAGDDSIYDPWGANTVRGGAGNDTINTAGTIEGGAGNDTITGAGNSTIYIFNAGDGIDTVNDYGYGAESYADTLQLGAGITPASVTLVRTGNDLTFRFSETDQVTVKNWYADVYYNAIERVTFADGTVWDLAAIQGMTPQMVYGGGSQFASMLSSRLVDEVMSSFSSAGAASMPSRQITNAGARDSANGRIVSSWSRMEALLEFRGNDDSALGGDSLPEAGLGRSMVGLGYATTPEAKESAFASAALAVHGAPGNAEFARLA